MKFSIEQLMPAIKNLNEKFAIADEDRSNPVFTGEQAVEDFLAQINPEGLTNQEIQELIEAEIKNDPDRFVTLITMPKFAKMYKSILNISPAEFENWYDEQTEESAIDDSMHEILQHISPVDPGTDENGYYEHSSEEDAYYNWVHEMHAGEGSEAHLEFRRNLYDIIKTIVNTYL